VRKSLPQEPKKSHVESSSIALARSHRRPTYSSMKIRQGLKTEYLVLLVESTSSVLAVKSDIRDRNPRYPVDKHLCYGVMEV